MKPLAQQHHRRQATAALLAAAALTATSACRAPLPFTNAASAPAATGTYQLIQEPDAGYRWVSDLIGGARRSIDITLYELADTTITDDLIDAHQRGVAVRVLLDADYHGGQVNAATYNQLHDAGVGVRWAPADVIYHQKTITVDGQVSAIGTGNLVRRYYRSGRDAWVMDRDPANITAISNTFAGDYDNTSGRVPAAADSPNLIWSPAARKTFLDVINGATSSIDLTTEELKDHAIVGALARAARRGVRCRVVINADPGAQHAIDDISTAGCSVHLLHQGAQQLYMHEKVIIVDAADGHGDIVIGSTNLSTQSLLDNRELSLHLNAQNAAAVLAAADATFQHDYDNAA